METKVLSGEELAEFGEFQRVRREAEVSLQLTKLIVDASRRETDRSALKAACELAKKLNTGAVLVSPVNVAAARRLLAGSGVTVVCLAGGTGESLPVIKRAEAKRAARQGAREIRLVLTYSALTGGNAAYLKREVRKVRKAVRKCALVLSLEDHTLSEEGVAVGVRAACEGGANGVCVRGELPLVRRAAQLAAGRAAVECSQVENAAQLQTVLRAGAARVTTRFGGEIAKELYEALKEPPAKEEEP